MAYVISIRRGVFADKLALLPNGGGKGGGPFYSQAPKEKGKIYTYACMGTSPCKGHSSRDGEEDEERMVESVTRFSPCPRTL
uniref:Uncharacterized protein n=1 Tax=Vespula pensylvanica TaxID=30213 RepID=A0A834K2H6_VESPE|nr:hypothetical protein H0235_015999 [Vespula pensylvanica]